MRVAGTTLVHVGVRATDLERTISFWRDALGLRVVNTGDGLYDLTDGMHNFRIFQYRGPARTPHVSDLLDYLHVGIVVEDLYVTAERCRALGFPPVYEGLASDQPYDPAHPPADAFKVEDPDGIVVDVAARRSQWPGIQEGFSGS
jgi:catechol 2,3-dioxygenase-like lactoylglutathione lyase family enzyme